MPAFIGAEGFGQDSTGARGGSVKFVTNTDNMGDGSLRAALEASGARYVIFRVGGTISLLTPIDVDNGDLYIAGQTAPGDGIMVKAGADLGGPVITLKSNDIVVRFLRLRSGLISDGGDALNINGGTDNIIDHSSFGWAWDENLVIYPSTAQRITIQRSIISESLNGSGPGAGGRGLLIRTGATDISIHHNYFHNNFTRVPEVHGGDLDWVNNLTYSGDRGILANFLDSTGNMNFVGNFIRLDPAKIDFENNLQVQNFGATSSVWFDDNLTKTNGSQAESDISNDGVPISGSRFAYPQVTTIAASAVPADILANVGVNMPVVDAIDQRVIDDYNNFTNQGVYPADEANVGGFPTYASGAPYLDSNSNGMSDEFEQRMGVSDSNGLQISNNRGLGEPYENLEWFLMELAGDITTLSTLFSVPGEVIGVVG